MIVVDASVALAALLNAGTAREALGREQAHAPHLIDSEIANGLRRRVIASQLPLGAASAALRTWQRIGITRYAAVGLLGRVWELCDDVSAYDACYIALAELLDCSLFTADARLARAPGLRCPITVVPR